MIPKRWIAAYLRFLLRNRLAVTIVTTVMTIFFAYQCTHIKVLPQFLDFYPGPLKLTILASSDGGGTWTVEPLPIQLAASWIRSVALTPAGHGLAVGAEGLVFQLDGTSLHRLGGHERGL